jgi:hypothetical protein
LQTTAQCFPSEIFKIDKIDRNGALQVVDGDLGNRTACPTAPHDERLAFVADLFARPASPKDFRRA